MRIQTLPLTLATLSAYYCALCISLRATADSKRIASRRPRACQLFLKNELSVKSSDTSQTKACQRGRQQPAIRIRILIFKSSWKASSARVHNRTERGRVKGRNYDSLYVFTISIFFPSYIPLYCINMDWSDCFVQVQLARQVPNPHSGASTVHVQLQARYIPSLQRCNHG